MLVKKSLLEKKNITGKELKNTKNSLLEKKYFYSN
jgi:hypothetical protein